MPPLQVIAQDLGDKRVEALLHPAEGGGLASSWPGVEILVMLPDGAMFLAIAEKIAATFTIV